MRVTILDTFQLPNGNTEITLDKRLPAYVHMGDTFMLNKIEPRKFNAFAMFTGGPSEYDGRVLSITGTAKKGDFIDFSDQ